MRIQLVAASLLMTFLAAAMVAPSASAVKCEAIKITDTEYAQSNAAYTVNGCDAINDVLGVPFNAIDLILGTADGVVDFYDRSDEDDDGIPDIAESEICSRQIVHDSLNFLELPIYCASQSDLVIPATPDVAAFADEQIIQPAEETRTQAEEDIKDAVGEITFLANAILQLATDTANFAINLVDSDGDRVLDVLEPFICAVESSNDLDGSRSDDNEDYTPPS